MKKKGLKYCVNKWMGLVVGLDGVPRVVEGHGTLICFPEPEPACGYGRPVHTPVDLQYFECMAVMCPLQISHPLDAENWTVGVLI